MKISKNAICGSLAAAALGIAGCGGSSSATAGYPISTGDPTNIPGTPAVSAGTTVRTLVNGDSYSYKITGTVNYDYLDAGLTKRTINAPVTGTDLRTVTATTFNGIPCFQITDTMEYKPTGATSIVDVSEQYVVQNADSSLTLIGKRDHVTDFTPAAQSTIVPGTFAAGTGAAGSFRFTGLAGLPTSAKSLETSLTVSSLESVPATTGSYTAWKANWSSSDISDFDPISRVTNFLVLPAGWVAGYTRGESGTDWWCPSISAPVKRVLTITESDTIILSYTYSSGTFSDKTDVLKSTANLTLTLQTRTLN